MQAVFKHTPGKKGKKLLCLSLAIIMLCLCTVMLRFRYPSVRAGITMSEAQRYVDSQDGYFIITQDPGGTGIGFLIAYGEDKGIEVVLVGNSPRKSLSNVFFLSKSNFFLVQGEERNTHNRGKQLLADGLDSTEMYTIDVKQWDIIIPIHRDYQYTHHTRWFYPLWYIDSFDVDNQDYRMQTPPRTPILGEANFEYEVDEDSVYYDHKAEKPGLSVINNYRRIEVATTFSLADMEKQIDEVIEEAVHRVRGVKLGNALLPHLLCEKSIDISDEELENALQVTNLDVQIRSFQLDGMNHRVILLSSKEKDKFFMDGHAFAFTQSWNDTEIRAQPVIEGLPGIFWDEQCPVAYAKSTEGEDLLLFFGYNNWNIYSNIGALEATILCWVWDDGLWVPCASNQVIIDCTRNLHHPKDGIRFFNRREPPGDIYSPVAECFFFELSESEKENKYEISVKDYTSSEVIASVPIMSCGR